MTAFSSKQINELIALFREELGMDVSADEAILHGTQLINLLLAVYKD